MQVNSAEDMNEAPSATLKPLILDLLEWIGDGSRPYSEVMEAWRTSCPRLPVWEDACALGYVEIESGEKSESQISRSALGNAFLAAARGRKDALARANP